MEVSNYRKILRLVGMGLNRTDIGTALGYSRNTVAEVLRRAQVKGIESPDDLDDWELGDMLFPKKSKDQNHKMPDCEKLHRELGKSGVTGVLLWDGYRNECRQNEEIPAFTQFRYLIICNNELYTFYFE